MPSISFFAVWKKVPWRKHLFSVYRWLQFKQDDLHLYRFVCCAGFWVVTFRGKCQYCSDFTFLYLETVKYHANGNRHNSFHHSKHSQNQISFKHIYKEKCQRNSHLWMLTQANNHFDHYFPLEYTWAHFSQSSAGSEDYVLTNWLEG